MIERAGHITVRGLAVEAHIGVTDEERRNPQKLLIDVDIEADLSAAALSDDVSDTIDYGTIVEEVARLVESSNHRLLERLGAEIAELICSKRHVGRVTVVVAKESPPVEQTVDGISVGVTRTSGEIGQ
ncbi:MAG: dihydroneopterin aldolase [Actinomycetota bacterium]|nr:dihydroneopterin aldolase [Actinomycetota bacterium]